VTPIPYANADDYEVMLASATLRMTTLPASMDFDATCIGVDSQVPVIVTARIGGAPIAYTAGTVAVSNGVATFAASSWLPVTPNIPIQSTDPTTQIDVSLWIDGLQFFAPVSATGALRWEGLAVDHSTVHARRGEPYAFQDTTRDQPSAPTAIAFDGGDFLPTIDPTLTFTGLPAKQAIAPPLQASWDRSQVTADVLALSVDYLTKLEEKAVLWTIVLAPDSTAVMLPRFEGAFEAFAPRDAPSNLLQWIDSPDLVGFDAVREAGVFALSATDPGRIVGPVSSGQLRQSAITWYGPSAGH
jgi:hypothetical protein